MSERTVMPNNDSPRAVQADNAQPRSHAGGAVTEAEIGAAWKAWDEWWYAAKHEDRMRAALEAAAAMRSKANRYWNPRDELDPEHKAMRCPCGQDWDRCTKPNC